ncbi:MAG: M48 family metallopeptidase [Ignavibacteriae bacterium]|nr:M48 family metallopeptidase [Ignavibacteriota bacterium]MCB9216322.1 M48 family metallopeptidase [Ignavibacteria bacterium]
MSAKKKIIVTRKSAEINGQRVVYLVRRNPRAKHMRLQVNPFDGVVLTMPARLPLYVNTDKFVREHGTWVLEKLREYGRKSTWDSKGEATLRSGESIQFRGKTFRLMVERLAVSDPHVVLNQQVGVISVYLPRSPEVQLQPALKAWLRGQAAEQITSVALEEARRIGVRFRKVSIREQRTKWGSCTEEGNLSFNWRLILFPPRVLRYVVIHELCHLRHFDHSIRFWRTVAQYMPDYRYAVDWLCKEGLNARNLVVEL